MELTTTFKDGMIAFNEENLRNDIMAIVDEYKGMVFTDQKDVKTERTKIRKAIAAVEDKRKEVKNTYMGAYNDFEKKIKDVLAPLQAVEADMKKQLDELEEVRKAEKQELIEEAFLEQDWPFDVQFSQVFDPKWLNASESMDSVKKELHDRAFHIRQSLESIDKLPNSFYARKVFESTLDMNRAIVEAERMAQMEAAKAEAEKPKKPEMPKISTEKTVTATFRVRGTIPQLKALKAYMDESGLIYEG